MNNKQWIILLLGIILFSLSELFPPWLYEDGWNSAKRPAGYHFLYDPPKVKSTEEMRRLFQIPDNEPPHYIYVERDLARLHGQRIVLVFLAIGLLLVLANRRSVPKVVFGSISLVISVAFLGLYIWEVSRY